MIKQRFQFKVITVRSCTCHDSILYLTFYPILCWLFSCIA